MIVVKLMGGLGNQMFQYACGKALSIRLHKKLVLDKRFLLDNRNTPGVTPREYELSVFNLPEEVTVYREKFGLHPSLPYRLNKFLDPFVKKLKGPVEFRDTDSLEELIKIKPETIILHGYFQKESYFKEFENAIRKAFVFKDALTGENADLAAKIKNSNSVSVHVRRGDYISDPKTNAYHGVCSIDYYEQALDLIRNKTADPYFFVFSDDPEWCRTHLGINDNVTFVSHNTGLSSYIDMRLMSLCRHNIIANSSFSWWGAWLNVHEHKLVIAPKKWFLGSEANTHGLYPTNWFLL